MGAGSAYSDLSGLLTDLAPLVGFKTASGGSEVSGALDSRIVITK